MPSFFIGEEWDVADCKVLQIGSKALLVSFIRAKVGTEFNVADRLKKRFPQDIESVSYYSCYGRYDLVEFQMVDSYESVHNIPFDKDIIDCEFSLFYTWEGISENFHKWANGYSALTIVLLKIHPYLEETLSLEVEREAINYIKGTFEDNVNLFASMGRSEILLLLRGSDFASLLESITDLRQKITISEVLNDPPVQYNPDASIFIGSSSAPVIAHPILVGAEDYNALEGKVHPLINITCHPGYEKLISNALPPSCSRYFNVYGNHDIAIAWNDEVNLSVFAKELTELRKTINKLDGTVTTETSFLGIQEIGSKSPEEFKPLCDDVVSEVLPGMEEIHMKSELLNPTEKASLLEFIGRLNSYYGRLESKSLLEDMTGIHHTINTILDSLDGLTDESLVHEINTSLSEIIDLANNALYQRYSGLETHFDTCKHIPYPFLRGINVFSCAATCIPLFIFKAIHPEKNINDIWPGFVVFGMSYSYQLFLDGKILSYPANFLYRPIEDWWGITHEVAHAIYWISNFYGQLPEKIKEYYEDLSIKDDLLLSMDIEEVYANWVDFKFIFKGDKERYFPIIWKSWLRWNRVKRFRQEYILRSLLVFLTSDLERFHQVQNNESREQTREYIKSKLNEMNNMIIPKVPEYKAYIDDISLDEIVKTIDVNVAHIEHYLNYLEVEYFHESIFERLNPPYPEELLREHLDLLEQGLIVTGVIPSPIRLLHELYDAYYGSNKDVPFQTTVATVLTLWIKYLKESKQ